MRVLSIISLILTIIIAVALVVFFAIEKTIPLDWAKQTIVSSASEIQVADFDAIKKKEKFGCRKVVTEYNYSETGIRTIGSRTAVKVELVGSGENMIVRKVVTEYSLLMQPTSETSVYYYKKNGDEFWKFDGNEEISCTGPDWKEGIVSALREAFPVNSATGEFLYADVLESMESVSQIGVYVNGHIKVGDGNLTLAYDYMNRQLKSVTYVVDTKTGDKVTATTETEYQILFPSSIALPDGVST